MSTEIAALKDQLIKRLAPLYIAAFFQSFILWYAIEKQFMRSIGFTSITIGLNIAVYSAVMLVVETPSGILADRWSRKGVLILASVCLAVSSLVGGLSHGLVIYILQQALWGVFYACYSGMYDSITYDAVFEVTGTSQLFEFFYGRIQAVEGMALVVGGLAGGLVAGVLGLRATYFLTVPLALVAIGALLHFREPMLHKKASVILVKDQIVATLQAILQNRHLFPVIVVLILRSALIYTIYEFAQLWLLALHTPTKYYGLAYAVLFSSFAAGGILADRLRLVRYWPMLSTLGVVLLSSVGLVMLRNTAAIVIAQFTFACALISIFVIFNRILHDNLAPSIRAGASSATSTISRFLIIPLAILFGYLSQRFTVYKAAYTLVMLAIIMTAFVLVVANRNHRTGLTTS